MRLLPTAIRSLFILSWLLATATIASAQVVKTVGATGNYPNLRSAFDAINNKTLTGAIELQIISSVTDNNSAKLYGSGQVGEVVTIIDVNSGSGYAVGDIVTFSAPETSGGTTATGRVASLYGGTPAGRIWTIEVTNPGSGYINPPTVAISSTSGTGANPTVLLGGDYSSVTIYPTVSGAVISGSIQLPIVDLNGADNVTIDGRVNRTGTIADLTIQNTNSLSSSPSIRASNDARGNTVRYVKLLNGRSERMHLFATNNGLGVYDFLFENNLVSTLSGAPTDFRRGVLIFTPLANPQLAFQNIIIRGNDFVNMLATSADMVLINGNSTKTSDIEISGNHFYQTVTLSLTANSRAAIRVINGSSIDIKNNYIGGSARFTGGTPWTHSSSGNDFHGIQISSDASNISIQGNAFANFNTTMTSGSLYGIRSQATNVSIGTEESNTIGSLTQPGSLTCTNCGIFGIFTQPPSGVTNDNQRIQNNIIGGFEAGASSTGISKGTGTGNIIGNTLSSMRTSSGTISAIVSTSTSGADIIGNYISGITNSAYNGIIAYGGTIANNIIHVSANGLGTVYGINRVASNNLNLYYNTIVIDGTVSTGSSETAALYDFGSGTRDYRNNHFINQVANTGAATASHYAVKMASAPTTLDYNNYYATNSAVLGSFLLVNKTTLSDWKTATNKDCFSYSIDPNFTSISGYGTSNFLPTETSLAGQALATVTTDFAGTARSATTPAVGAIEYNVIRTGPVLEITSFTPSSGGAGTVVTISGDAFTGATAVRFNGISATSFTVVDANTITAVVPNNASTTGKITVVTPCGTVVSATDFTFLIVPTAPTGLIATSGNGQATITFTAAGTNGGSAITNYEYTLDGGQTWTAFDPADTTSPVTVLGLTNGTSYTIQLRAISDVGAGSASTSVTVTPATVPSAPTELSATVGDKQVTIAFTEGSNGGSAITNYEYTLDGGTTWVAFNPVDTTSPVTITGLTNGTEYDVQIRAVNAVGSGVASEASAVTPRTVPGEPAITAITPGNGTASVAFTEPASDGGSEVTNYEYSTDGGTTWTTLDPASTASPFTITGLKNGTQYSVRLRAVNAAGSGAASEASIVTPRTVPGAPAITAITPSNGTASVAFTEPASNGGSAVTNYEYSTDGGTTWIALDPASTASPFTITGLKNGTEYSVKLRAMNAAGSGGASEASTVTPRTVPSVPTNLVATPGDGQIEIDFTAGFDGGSPVTNYEYSLDGGKTWVASDPPVNTSPITITGLDNSKEYTIQIRAVNAAGPGPTSDSITASPVTVPSAPTGMVATPGDGQIAIAFTPGNDGGSPVTNYEYSLDGGLTWITLVPADATSPITIAGLNNGTEYTVQIRAVNAAGSGAASGDVTATPVTVPSAPTNLVATVGDAQIEIAFTAGDDGGSAVTNYEYSLDGGATWIAFSPAVTSSPVTITGLQNNTEYTVILRARNDVGPGSPSSGVTIKLNDYSDKDGDGVPLFQEIIDGTDPTDTLDYKDSDGDGVPDYIENKDGTDPNDAADFKDSDAGGTPDYVESILWPNLGLDPGNISNKNDDSRDSDGDGVPDYQEFLDGTDPKDKTDYKDSDGDQVPNYVEIADGTNTLDPSSYKDTDGDGVPDYVEAIDGTDPNDASDYRDGDGDRVPNYIEARQGTDPADALSYRDSDGDLVPDYIEARDGTNPEDSTSYKDTDRGGVPDYVETVYFPNRGYAASDAAKADDDNRDSDSDGVSDYREILDGTDPFDNLSFVDTDGDGVPNQVEERDGTDPNDALSYRDTDGDQVPNYIESRQGTSSANPLSYLDSDGDLVPDYIEARDGTDPKDPASFKDTDKGGAPDYVEAVYYRWVGLSAGDPNTAGDDGRDSDGDGKSDYAELLAGTNPLNSQDYGFTRGTGSCSPYDPYKVETVYHLSAIRQQPDKCYLQTVDIDARVTASWNRGQGFVPIGADGPAFSGRYDGDGYRITGLYIEAGTTQADEAPGAALFGKVTGSPERPVLIEDTHLDSITVQGHSNVAAMVGYGQWVRLSQVSSQGQIRASGQRAGGLVGSGQHLSIEDSYSVVVIDGAADWKGGLAGLLRDSQLARSYFAGRMSASAKSAGLVAYAERTSLKQTYSSMRGLTSGVNTTNSVMSGLAVVSEGSSAENSYWEVSESKVYTSALGQLATGVQMMDPARFTGWDFTQTWAIATGDSLSYPYLRSNLPKSLPGHRPASYVQVIHNMAAGSVGVQIDQISRHSGLSAQGATAYLRVPSSAAFVVDIVSQATGKTLISYSNAPLAPGQSQLIYLSGGDNGSSPQLISFDDTKRKAPSATQLEVTFVHGASPYKQLDLDYVTSAPPVAVIRNIGQGIAAGNKSAYRSLIYTPVKSFRLSANGQNLGVFNFGLDGLSGQAVKIVALGTGASKQVNGLNLVAVTADGRVIQARVGTNLEEAEVPSGFALHGNYPNPFNPTTNVRFDLPEQAKVRIDVVDVLGRQVMSLQPQTMSAGANKTITLDASRLSSGTYFYRIIAEGATRTYVQGNRFTLVK